jgi:hypothetical protein
VLHANQATPDTTPARWCLKASILVSAACHGYAALEDTEHPRACTIRTCSQYTPGVQYQGMYRPAGGLYGLMLLVLLLLCCC